MLKEIEEESTQITNDNKIKKENKILNKRKKKKVMGNGAGCREETEIETEKGDRYLDIGKYKKLGRSRKNRK